MAVLARAQILVVAATVACLPALAVAQVITAPPRSTGGILGGGNQPADPDRTRSELGLVLNALGGWDDDLPGFGPAAGLESSGLERSGYVGTGGATLRYWRGRAARSFEASGRLHMTSYTNLGVDPLVGGGGLVGGQTRLWRGGVVAARATAVYAPTLVLAAFGPVQTQVDSGVVAISDPTSGFTETRSTSQAAGTSLGHDWTPRQHTRVAYDIERQRFLDDQGVNGIYRTGSIDHRWDFSRAVGMGVGYRYSKQEQSLVLLDRTSRSHSGDFGFDFRKAISRTRRMNVSVRGGATRIDTVSGLTGEPFDYWAPSGSGSVRVDLARTWAVSADYRRDANVLEGVALETFLTDAVSVTVGGNFSPRVSMAVSAAYSEGSARGTDTGAYEGFLSVAQLQYVVSRCCSLVSSYQYDEHLLRDVSVIPQGFPRRFERNAFRVGFTMRLPLYGTFGPVAPGGGN